MNGYKRFITIYLSTITLCTTGLLSALYTYDPLNIFHPVPNKEARIISDLRQQAIGFIRYADYDSVILGTSMLENTSAKEASMKLGGKFINLSLSGATYHVRSFPLKKILENRPIKQVIYSMDFLYGAGYGHLSVDYLYDNNRLNDFKVYLNKKYLTCLLHWSDENSCKGEKLGLDKPTAWSRNPNEMSRFGGAKNWTANKHLPQVNAQLKYWKEAAVKAYSGTPTEIPEDTEKLYLNKITNQIQDSIIHYVKNYPDTKFTVIFPPYYIENFADWQQSYPSRMRRYIYTLRYMTKQSEKYKNLSIYGFSDEVFTHDIANYKDNSHYHPKINSHMINKLSINEKLLTNNNIEQYINSLVNHATTFDLVKEYEKFNIGSPITHAQKKSP